jgi:hypothetical protein
MPSELGSLLQRQIGIVGHQAIADALGKDRSTVTKMISGDIPFRLNNPECIETFLRALGLTVVVNEPDGYRRISERKYQALITFADEGMQGLLKSERPSEATLREDTISDESLKVVK